MKHFFHRGFLIAAMFFVAVTYTGAYFSDSVAVSGNTFTAGTWDTGPNIILNEAMVNPSDEGGSNPGGEWIELYNAGASAVDVNGWYIYDNASGNYIISSLNTNTGLTTILSGGYLAVYKNGPAIFNNDGDSVRIYDGPIATGTLIDSMTYTSSTDSKTWSIIPNVTGTWLDNRTPSPGGPNV